MNQNARNAWERGLVSGWAEKAGTEAILAQAKLNDTPRWRIFRRLKLREDRNRHQWERDLHLRVLGGG